MMLQLKGVLDAKKLENVRNTLNNGHFVDGRLSAGQAARRVKNNQELAANAQMMALLNDAVMGSLMAHPDYRAGVMPLRVASPFYARYTAGMAYGDHIDDPIMGASEGQPYRTDVSTTIFLSDANEYEGGELVIHTAFGEQRVKLDAGDAVAYPSGTLHRVAEVTSGERLVAVTWAQSLIRDPAQRELLYTLYQAKSHLLENDPESTHTKQVDTAYINLVRMWGEI